MHCVLEIVYRIWSRI